MPLLLDLALPSFPSTFLPPILPQSMPNVSMLTVAGNKRRSKRHWAVVTGSTTTTVSILPFPLFSFLLVWMLTMLSR